MTTENLEHLTHRYVVEVDDSSVFEIYPRDIKVYLIKPSKTETPEQSRLVWKTLTEGEEKLVEYLKQQRKNKQNQRLYTPGRYMLAVSINKAGLAKKEDELLGRGKSSLFWWKNQQGNFGRVSYELENGMWRQIDEISHHEQTILDYEKEAFYKYLQRKKGGYSTREAYALWYDDTFI